MIIIGIQDKAKKCIWKQKNFQNLKYQTSGYCFSRVLAARVNHEQNGCEAAVPTNTKKTAKFSFAVLTYKYGFIERFPFDQKFQFTFPQISFGEWNSIWRNYRIRNNRLCGTFSDIFRNFLTICPRFEIVGLMKSAHNIES